jgi:hypothetical protein
MIIKVLSWSRQGSCGRCCGTISSQIRERTTSTIHLEQIQNSMAACTYNQQSDWSHIWCFAPSGCCGTSARDENLQSRKVGSVVRPTRIRLYGLRFTSEGVGMLPERVHQRKSRRCRLWHLRGFRPRCSTGIPRNLRQRHYQPLWHRNHHLVVSDLDEKAHCCVL